VLVPGFLVEDGFLALLTYWLRAAGYRTRRAGIGINVDCSEKACATLESLLETLATRYGRRVAIIGHSRGGVLAKAVAAARPDLVSGIVTLAAPTVARFPPSPLLLGHIAVAAALRTGHLPGLISWRCAVGSCGNRYRRALRAPFPGVVGFVSVFSRRDGFVDWRACRDPAAELVEIESTHIGMAFNADAYRQIALALSAFAAADVVPRRSGRPAAAA
jgi:pimeloyl-ACP methyl ester carboxylesterase